MKRGKIFVAVMCLMLFCNLFSPILQQMGLKSLDTPFCVTAYADDTATGGLEVEDGTSGGLVISPGHYPSLNGDLQDTVDEANAALSRYKMTGNFVIACILLGMLALLILNITKFAGSGSDERTRKQAMNGILFCGISIALIGGLAVITNLARNLF